MIEQQPAPFPFPTFFLVGAPRCGTTALSKYLSENPQVCFSKPKEPHYFSILIRELEEPDLARDYCGAFFSHCTPEHKAVGEGSVSYLYDPDAIETILGINPDAKLIVMVRNPADMIYSYHARLLAVVEEDVEDFATAWSLQAERREGRRLPKHCHDPNLLQYAEVGMLGKQLERLFRVAGPERCLVLVYDDLVADTLGVYKRALEFIGAEYDGRTEFPRVESNKYIRARWLQRLLKRPSGKVADFVRTMDQQQKRKGRRKSRIMRIRKWLLKKNKVVVTRPPLDAQMREVLNAAFAEDIAHLGRLIERDLSHWG